MVNGPSCSGAVPLFNRTSFVAPAPKDPLNAEIALLPGFKFVVTVPELAVEVIALVAAVMLPLPLSLIAKAAPLSEPAMFRLAAVLAEIGALIAMPVPAAVDVEVILTKLLLELSAAPIVSVVPLRVTPFTALIALDRLTEPVAVLSESEPPKLDAPVVVMLPAFETVKL